MFAPPRYWEPPVIRFVLAALALPLLAAPLLAAPPAKGRATEVKVYVLNFDPVIDAGLKTRLHQECKWHDPRKLAEQHAADVKEASGGLVTFKIVGWEDLDEFPVKADGFSYTAKTYMECFRANKGWHKADLTDYPKVIAKYKLAEKVEKGECDEVWWFGAPYFGFGESAMAGRGAFYINGPVYDGSKVPCKRAFAIMGFNYERGPAEMIHNLCHRTESTMSRVFGGWQVDKLDTDWARFAANAKQSNGTAAVGTCHYTPNAIKDYDYANTGAVESTADDWLNYPNLTGAKTKVSRDTWGGPDYQRNYLKWWFARLPRAAGVNANGRLNNWWEYVYRFNEYDARGRAVVPSDSKNERAAARAVLSLGGRVTVSGPRGAVQVAKPADLPDGDFEVTVVALVGVPLKEADLAALTGLPRLRHLDLGGSTATDAALANLGTLPALEWLSVSRTKVTDKGLAAVKKFPELAYLELNNLPLTDAGVAALAKHPALREVHLTDCARVSDTSVPALAALPKLATLSLAGTALTDTGLARLAGTKGLKVLWLTRTKVSDAAVERLRAALPGLTVNR